VFLQSSCVSLRRIQLIDGVIAGRSDPITDGTNGKTGKGDWLGLWLSDRLWTHTHMEN
jgi:hypothetical protein